jgi:DNA-binding protein
LHPEKPMAEDAPQTKRDLVVVGDKPTMNYVVACMTLFNSGVKPVKIRARGRHIEKAVDAVELLRRTFIRDAKLESIEIGTDELVRQDGSKANISVVEIRVSPS